MIEIHQAARKHRVTDADIAHAHSHAVYRSDFGDEEPPPRVLYLGPDRAANLLEIITLIRPNLPELAIHAMPARPQYLQLLRRPRGNR